MPGTGGGGGSMTYGIFDAPALSATLNIVIGTAGTGGAGATSHGAGAAGTQGSDSSVALVGNNTAGADNNKVLLLSSACNFLLTVDNIIMS